jgi:integrase/recombinase XerD
MLLEELHKKFIRESKYLNNLAPKTITFLEQAFTSLKTVLPETKEMSVDSLTSEVLENYVITLRESGRVNPRSCNTYISGLNCFLTWLFDRKHTATDLKIKKLRLERTLPKTVNDEVMEKLLAFKSPHHRDRRVHAIVLTILDTGLRINEVLTLAPDAVDLDDLMLRVMGKGRKERIVPFSPELRRVLMRYLRSPNAQPKNAEFFFCTREGSRLGYRNLNRDYNLMCNKIGVTRTGGFHQLRHTFATNFMRLGGNQFHLKAILGHAQLSTTDIYVHADSKSLRESQERFSALVRRTT